MNILIIIDCNDSKLFSLGLNLRKCGDYKCPNKLRKTCIVTLSTVKDENKNCLVQLRHFDDIYKNQDCK